MKKSKVFFKRLKDKEGRASINNSLQRLIEKTSILDFIKKNDFTGIKMHLGEKGNEGYIKSGWIKSLISSLNRKTKNLFITDANVLYRSGLRWNSVGHLKIAYEHGFDAGNLGIPVIISDGIMGRSYRNMPIRGKHFKEVKIASDYFDMDALVCLAHLTGHMYTSIAASIKNIGMGCASRAGKLEQHSSATPDVSVSDCTGCGLCARWCPENAISVKGGKAVIDTDICVGCGECTVICRCDAIKISWSEKIENLQEKMVEYAYGITQLFGSKIAFFNFLINITKDCDCLSEKVKKIAPDIGILASCDPVAIDKASLDLVNEAEKIDIFKVGYPDIDWVPQFRYAEEIGLGSSQYDLIEID